MANRSLVVKLVVAIKVWSKSLLILVWSDTKFDDLDSICASVSKKKQGFGDLDNTHASVLKKFRSQNCGSNLIK